MFTLTLSLNDIRKLALKEFGYTDEDINNVEINLINEFGNWYVRLVDHNLSTGPTDEPVMDYEAYAEALAAQNPQ